MDIESWVSRVDARLRELVAEQSTLVSQLGRDVTDFTNYANTMLAGGKRFRAVFCALGFATTSPTLPDSLCDLAVGLEIFHAAALAHDDIMDHSDTRRGAPSAHRRFEDRHVSNGWAGDAEHFGTSSALLFGDFLLALSDVSVSRGLASHADLSASMRARTEFDRMRLDVTAGQYLDIVEENAWPTVSIDDALGRAATVLTYKSAKYSIEAPLTIGALLGGASDDQISGLRAFALPLGNAFQLRDDILGVFGDPAVTGKPVGDDLREGKRTVLIALTMAAVAPDTRNALNAVLGNNAASADEIRWAQSVCETTGARAQVEARIDDEFKTAMGALDSIELNDEARASLIALAHRVVKRDF
jgi:geranylgeranyl diphosphate synthase type I